MNFDDPDERSAAAGEYVLGTLDKAASEQLEARLATDDALRLEVYRWQDRLLPLTGQIVSIEPRPSLWEGIAARLPGVAPARAAANDPLWRSLRRWRATAAFGLAASLALATLLTLRTPSEPPERYLTLLQAPDSQRTGWIVEATAGERIRLVPVGAPEDVPPGKALQFWTKPQDAQAPTSLGLVRPGSSVDLPAARSPAIGAQQLFELTLEPAAGSPTGLPTGPILYVGRSVRL